MRTDGLGGPLNGGRAPEAWTLGRLLAPTTLGEFAERYWARQPLHVQHDPAFFADLVSVAELERYLAVGELFTRHTVETVSCRDGVPDPSPLSVREVNERLRRGDSLRLRRLECLMDPEAPIVRLAREIERTLQHPLDSLSCYLSPSGAFGLGPHHDETEIFTLQIEGTKQWRIFDRSERTAAAMYDATSLPEPALEVTMAPGDVLYLPHGFVHDVESEVPAFSVTLVFAPFRWSTVLDLLTSRLATGAPFTDVMPLGTALDGDPHGLLGDQLELCRKVIRAALDDLDEQALMDEAAVQLLSRMTAPPGHAVTDALGVDRLDGNTLVRRRPDVAFRLIRGAGTVRLVLPGADAIQADARAGTALEAVLHTSGPFRVGDMDPSLQHQAKVALARALVVAGLLEVIDGDGR